jgi:polysaccharide deacetylase 2 family uncharacterized protein YibQ
MKHSQRRPRYICVLAAFFIALPGISPASEKLASIIIDDLGNSLDYGAAVLDIDAPLTLAMLPLTDYGATLADIAHKQGKEVMLHLPLQSVEAHEPTAGTLNLHMTHEQFVRQLNSDIASIPHLSGVNNHMGSLLTQHPGYMDWLMQELEEHGDLYFIDSRTTTKSVAAASADRHGIPHMDRDVFLDPDISPHTLQHQFERFIDIATRYGHAIAIAHPHPRTLEFLRRHIGDLEQHEITLVPVSTLLSKLKQNEEMSHVAHTGTTRTGL